MAALLITKIDGMEIQLALNGFPIKCNRETHYEVMQSYNYDDKKVLVPMKIFFWLVFD